MKKLLVFLPISVVVMTAGGVRGANTVNKQVAAEGYDLKALVEPITFSCELRDVRLTRGIDKMSSGELSVARITRSSTDRKTDSSGTRSTIESTTGSSSSNRNEGGHRSGTKFDAGGGIKWGLIPHGKVGGEYSEDEFDEWRRATDKTASNKRGNSTSNTTANERITAEVQDTTSESTDESRLGGYMLVFSVALRNMDVTDRLKVEGTHMRAQLNSDELPGTITAQYKDRGDFWLGAEETICRFTYPVEDMDMLKALLRLEKEGRLGQLKLFRSGADIVATSERTRRNVLSDQNAAEVHRPGTRFSVEFGELLTLPDWRVSHRHSAKSGLRGTRVSIHEALLAVQNKAIELSEYLPTNILTFADDGSLVKVIDRPLLDTDSAGRYRMFALRLTKKNGTTELCLPNAEIMKEEIAKYEKVALFSFDLEEFVNVSFDNPEYFSRLKNEVEKCLGVFGDKKALNAYKGLLEKRILEEDTRPLPEERTAITAADVKRYKERADAGIPNMQFKLALCLFAGHGVGEDKVEAVRWYRKAADQGHAEAQCNLGECYHDGEGVAKDAVEAVRWYRKAVDQGHAVAQNNLGVCYHDGEGVAKDVVEAMRWFRKAADQGLADAQYNLGECYYDGEGVAKDAVEAVKWLRKAADQGHAVAQNRLGWCYRDGEGVTKDAVEAVRWFRKAADQGFAAAQCNLGVCYHGGEGVAKDAVEAVRWFRKVADQGFAEAQYNLGECYDNGEGVAKDEGEAVKWWREAAKQGHNAAKNKLRSMGIEDSRNAPHQLHGEPLAQAKSQEKWTNGRVQVPKTGDTKTITLPGGATMDLIYCGPGVFLMGSPPGEYDRDKDEPLHRVELTKGFWLGKYEVTQEQWVSVMGSNPSKFRGDMRLPVENVSWEDCQVFILKLNVKLNCGARLPTEAEWEYACRAGTETPYSWGYELNGSKANCDGSYSPYGTTVEGPNLKRTTPVGQYGENPWGFCDMHGNVNEWCNDWYYGKYYTSSPATDPKGPIITGWSTWVACRVTRGGGWYLGPNKCRSAHRQWCAPANRLNDIGFRLCCSAEE